MTNPLPAEPSTAHRGDPCIYCATPHDAVEIGPCPSRPPCLFNHYEHVNMLQKGLLNCGVCGVSLRGMTL